MAIVTLLSNALQSLFDKRKLSDIIKELIYMHPLTDKRFFIFLLLILIGIFTLNNFLKLKNYRANSYTPKELEALAKQKDKYVVIDVRTKQEYDKGHIPGALHADYHNTEALKKMAAGKTPITYCSFSAMRGPYAAYQLYQAGFKDVSVLEGGMTRWAEEIQGLDADDPKNKSVFAHPKNIFPSRKSEDYPKNAGSVEINITAKRFEFTPNKIEVKHGQKVTLHLLSLDVTHGFALPEFAIEEELLPNETKSITFIADRKGNFPFVCNVICGSTHDHASMVGNIIVK